MSELLLELFSEEIPARMQARARADLARLLGDALQAAGLEYKALATFATPRRLTAVVEGLPARSPDIREERKGPRVDAPDAALKGFLKSAGLSSIEQAETRDDKKGGYYVALLERPGRATAEVIAEIVPGIVRGFPWPKSMRWGSGRLRWVRPLHAVLCLLDGKVVEFEIDGIEAGKETRGHRFMAPEPFAVKDFADYRERLRKAFVILDGEERASLIAQGARKLAAEQGLTLVEDEALLAENAGLTEWPVPLIGSFDAEFLDVPQEVLTTAMKAHQKCFSLKQREELANRFILVANLEAEDGGKEIVAGNERVIRARLSDAKFFFDQDRKIGLEAWVPKLKEIVFHEKLGTQYDRVQRVRLLARELAPLVGAEPDLAERAAILAKADLVSEMVGEFPELQGAMGRYYALDQEENPTVADAIEAHYKPLGPSDAVPREPVAIAVALADKLDTLVGFWAIDEKPTGSKDPYALRRAALGIIRIVLSNELRIPLAGLVRDHLKRFRRRSIDLAIEKARDWVAPYRKAADGKYSLISPARDTHIEDDWASFEKYYREASSESFYHEDIYFIFPGFIELDSGKIIAEVFDTISASEKPVSVVAGFPGQVETLLVFFADRLKAHLREQGARYDLVDAVFELGSDDLLAIGRRVEALGKFLKTEDGANLLTGTKRAINILRIEEKKDGTTYDQPPNPALFTKEEERTLYQATLMIERDIVPALQSENFAVVMRGLAQLRAPVDAFFDFVTVNTQEPGLRENRLRLLNRIRATTLTVADFSKIEG